MAKDPFNLWGHSKEKKLGKIIPPFSLLQGALPLAQEQSGRLFCLIPPWAMRLFAHGIPMTPSMSCLEVFIECVWKGEVEKICVPVPPPHTSKVFVVFLNYWCKFLKLQLQGKEV